MYFKKNARDSLPRAEENTSDNEKNDRCVIPAEKAGPPSGLFPPNLYLTVFPAVPRSRRHDKSQAGLLAYDDRQQGYV